MRLGLLLALAAPGCGGSAGGRPALESRSDAAPPAADGGRAAAPDARATPLPPDAAAAPPPGASGLPQAAPLGALTQEQRGGLCDWIAAALGGYGRVHNCPGGVLELFADRAACLAETDPGAACPATVSDQEACTREMSRTLCSLDWLTHPACETIDACVP